MWMMRALKYLISLWIALAVYSLLSIFFGPSGLSAYDQLSLERDRQRANMENLQLINRELEGAKDALLYDSDAIAVYARELGYGTENERFVRIVGLGSSKTQQISAGQTALARQPGYITDQNIRLIALAVGGVMLLCLWIFDLLRRLVS
jgi:cell division protein FtsB